MKKVVFGGLVLALICLAATARAEWKAVSDTKVSGFGHPESVAYNPESKELYVSRFGPQLKPLQKDGQGFISRVDMKGKILEEKFLPGPGQVLHKPKGIWVSGDRLWVTDIDSVWIFDLKTKKGTKTSLPGAEFANDPTLLKGRLYVSDMKTGVIFQIEPADFLNSPAKVGILLDKPGFGSNGLWPTPEETLLVAAFAPGQALGGLHEVRGGKAFAISPGLGSLDGLALLPDGTIIFTDWKNKGLFALSKDGQVRLLAGDFTGPADFSLVPQGNGYLVVVPDLVKGDLRFIRLALE